jgi:hypothetical protein
VHGIAERIKKSSETRRYYRPSAEALEVDQIGGRNSDVLRKRAVEMDAFDSNVLADVPLSRRALLAVAAKCASRRSRNRRL